MDDCDNKYFKNFLPFVSGVILGGGIACYYFFEPRAIIGKKVIEIKIVDNNGNAIIQDYHYNSSKETIVFKESLEDATVMLKFGKDKNMTLDKFSGSLLNLRKFSTNIITPITHGDKQT